MNFTKKTILFCIFFLANFTQIVGKCHTPDSNDQNNSSAILRSLAYLQITDQPHQTTTEPAVTARGRIIRTEPYYYDNSTITIYSSGDYAITVRTGNDAVRITHYRESSRTERVFFTLHQNQ